MVIAQYEKSTTIYYSLKIYSSAEFKCGKIKVPYKFTKKENGEWRGKTAGGCGNGLSRETVKNNPVYHISLQDYSDENALLIDLRAPKEYSIGMEVWQVSSFRNKPFENADSGAYRAGCTILALDGLPAGTYAIRPATFLAGQQGPFILRLECSCDFSIKRVQ